MYSEFCFLFFGSIGSFGGGGRIICFGLREEVSFFLGREFGLINI